MIVIDGNRYEAISKIDSRLKELFFGFLSKELTKSAMKIVKEQVGDFDSLFGVAKEFNNLSMPNYNKQNVQ